MNKICPQCKQSKEITDFYKSQQRICKSCHREGVSKSKYVTPERMIEYVIFSNIRRIAKSRKLPCQFECYQDIIDFLKSRDQWNRFVSMYNKYIKSGRSRNLAPSILRIDASKGYIADNIKLDYFNNHISTYRYENDEIITFKSNFIKHVKFDKIFKCWKVIHTYKKRNTIHIWKSFFPSKDVADYYDHLIKEEILSNGEPITKCVLIKNWEELYPDDYKKRLISHISNRKVTFEKKKFGYKVIVYDNKNQKGIYSYLPTKEAAIQHHRDSYVRMIYGLSPIPIRKRDWGKLGLL